MTTTTRKATKMQIIYIRGPEVAQKDGIVKERKKEKINKTNNCIIEFKI